MPEPEPPPTPPEPTPATLADITPEGFSDKPYMKTIQDIPALFNTLDNLQSKLGEKPFGIPDANASEETVKDFYSKLRGVKESGEYTFEETDYSKAHGVNEDFRKSMSKVLFEADLSQRQVSIVNKGYDDILMGMKKGQSTDQAAKDKDFEDRTSNLFGADKDRILGDVKKLLETNTDKSFAADVKDLDEKNLIIMSSVLNNVMEKYISEDDLTALRGSGGGGGGASTIEELRKDAQKLMALEAYRSDFHPDHESTINKVTEIYDTIRKLMP